MYAPRLCTTCKVLKFYREDMHEDAACIFAKQNKRGRSESLIYVGEDKRRLCFCRELIQRWKTLITLSRRTMAALWYARERKNRRGRAQLISIIRGNSRMQVKANRSAQAAAIETKPMKQRGWMNINQQFTNRWKIDSTLMKERDRQREGEGKNEDKFVLSSN